MDSDNDVSRGSSEEEIRFPNGDRVIGSTYRNSEFPSGKGEFFSGTTGDVIDGEFINGAAQGIGSMSRPNGDRFDGKFSGQNFENGVYSFASNQYQQKAVRFRGTFRENLPNGVGALEFTNGDIYEGSFDNGRPHGTGRYASASGDIIAGLFEDGRPVKGMKLSAAGHKYLGEFHPIRGGALYHGLGKLEFSNGDWYEGSFVDGYFSGEGIYVFADGLSVSCLTWVNDEPVGHTEVSLPDGSSFQGSFFSDRRRLTEGYGMLKFSDGSWFESRNFVKTSVIPTDYDGGAFYYNRKLESRSCCLSSY